MFMVINVKIIPSGKNPIVRSGPVTILYVVTSIFVKNSYFHGKHREQQFAIMNQI